MSGTILGMHVQRGQLDAVETMFSYNHTDIAEGRAVKLTAADTVAACSAAGDAVYGIAGGKRPGVGVAVVRNGKIWAELASGITPTLQAPAYVDAEGKLTTAATSSVDTETVNNTLVGYFTSTEVRTDGIQNVPSFADDVRCAQVFVDL